MCKVTSPYKNAGGIRGKTFTGYKAVIKVGNKLYSPVTGMVNENSVADLVVGNHIDKIEFIKKNENENTT